MANSANAVAEQPIASMTAGQSVRERKRASGPSADLVINATGPRARPRREGELKGMAAGILALGLAVSCPGKAAAEITYSEWRSQDAQDRAVTEVWLVGVESGLLWANSQLQQNGSPKLYCQPVKLSLTGDELVRILEEFGKAKDHPKADEYPLGMVMLKALQRVFPCPQPSPLGRQ